MSNDYINAAFHQICTDAKEPEPRMAVYVSLYENVPFYGGPEEGGWWGHDTVLVGYKQFNREAQAQTAADAVRELAERLGEESKRNYGERCREECDWLEARGLDADFFPEPDGPSSFFVITEDTPGSLEDAGNRHYS